MKHELIQPSVPKEDDNICTTSAVCGDRAGCEEHTVNGDSVLKRSPVQVNHHCVELLCLHNSARHFSTTNTPHTGRSTVHTDT